MKQFLVLRDFIKSYLTEKNAVYALCGGCTLLNVFTTVINFCPPTVSGMLWELNIMMMIICLSED